MIPSVLRVITRAARLEVSGETVGEVLHQLTQEFPLLDPYLLDAVNIYVNQKNIKDLAQQNTPLNTTDVITIVPAMAGG